MPYFAISLIPQLTLSRLPSTFLGGISIMVERRQNLNLAGLSIFGRFLVGIRKIYIKTTTVAKRLEIIQHFLFWRLHGCKTDKKLYEGHCQQTAHNDPHIIFCRSYIHGAARKLYEGHCQQTAHSRHSDGKT